MPAGSRVRLMPCFHRFHGDCIAKWLVVSKLKCPVCKQDCAEAGGGGVGGSGAGGGGAPRRSRWDD